nr:uncharacterized protein CTRU02_07959 [Colletotrichum truncatum]KAF6790439.1 hypothetical protein CTRU02_07959 [Colletotrichum truncatum]
MQRMTKREFNALITGLSIALSITVVKGLNDFVATFRWWILSRHHHSLRKVDLILQAESVSRVIMLAARTSRLKLHVAASLWLGLTLAAQVALALLGLCYSVEEQTSVALVVTAGKVMIPDMSSIETTRIVRSGPDSVEAQEYTANTYGQVSLAFNTSTRDQVPNPGTLWTASDPLMFCDEHLCEYIFHEKSVDGANKNESDDDDDDDDGHSKTLVVTTNRSILSAALCDSWRVLDGANGNDTRITLDTKPGSASNVKEVAIPVRGGVNQTTYMTDNTENCGSGCRIVTAFEVADTASWYYSCNVTVSAVGNVTLPEHEVSESLRSMAAASIALQGSAVLSLDDDNLQYQIYPSESVFGLPTKGFNSSMAMTMARFAIGTLAVTAHSNDPMIVDGFPPVQGSHVVVDHWDYASLILMSVVLAQLILGLATAIIASRVVIPEGGPIAMAQVLRLVADRVQDIDENNSVVEGKDGKQTGLWIYRAVKTADRGIYDLFMEEKATEQSDAEGIEMF